MADNQNPAPAPYNLNAQTPSTPAQSTQMGQNVTSSKIVTAVNTKTGKRIQLGEIGKSGTFVMSGIITQEDYLWEFTRFEGQRKIEIMRRSDPTIAAMLRAVKWPLKSTNWRLDPASENPLAKEAADYCEFTIFKNKLDFPSVLDDALLMLEFGWSLLEKVWGYTDYTPPPLEEEVEDEDNDQDPTLLEVNPVTGLPNPPRTPKKIIKRTPQPTKTMIGLDRLAFRKHRSIWKWETVDHQAGVTQYVPGQTFSIPMEKLMIFTFQKEGDNFEGISLLRQVYKNWDMKDKLVMIDAIRHERQGLGILEVIPPEGANQDDIDATVNAARAARANEEAVFQHPEGWVVEWMDMKSGSTQVTDILSSVQYHDSQILLAVLAQFMLLGQKTKGGSGSRAVSEDQSKLYEYGLETVAQTITKQFNDLIKQICDLNYGDALNGEYPTLEHDKIGDENVETVGSVVATLLAQNGITMDAGVETTLRKLLHLPDMTDEMRANYDDRLENAGKSSLPMPQDPANALAASLMPGGSNNPPPTGPMATAPAGSPAPVKPEATAQKTMPGAKPKPASKVTANEEFLDSLRQMKALAVKAISANQ